MKVRARHRLEVVGAGQRLRPEVSSRGIDAPGVGSQAEAMTVGWKRWSEALGGGADVPGVSC